MNPRYAVVASLLVLVGACIFFNSDESVEPLRFDNTYGEVEQGSEPKPVQPIAPVTPFKPTLIPLSNPNDPLRLLMISNGSAKCKEMLPIIYQANKHVDIVVADIRKGDNSERLKDVPISSYPYWIMYRGHEALEEAAGSFTEQNLMWWFGRIKRQELLPDNLRQQFWKSHTQDKLSNLDRVKIRQGLSEATCGMAWCYSHRYLIYEYVTEPEKKTCPIGGCPGGCP